MSDDNFYNIEKILDRRKNKNRLEYKIKWEGYPLSQCTWEPLENLQTCMELVEEYDQLHPLKTVKKGTKHNNKFLGKKKNHEKKEELEVIEEKTEGGQEKEKIEKLNNPENDRQPYTIIPPEEYCRKYNIDDSLKSVITVRKRDNKLVAVVEKLQESGDVNRVEIETNKLKTDNPWILLDFYESKIKFT